MFKTAWMLLACLFCMTFGMWLDRVLVDGPLERRMTKLEAEFRSATAAVDAQADELVRQRTFLRVIHPLLLWTAEQINKEPIELQVVAPDGALISGPEVPDSLQADTNALATFAAN